MNTFTLVGKVSRIFRAERGPARITVETPPQPGREYGDRNTVVAWPSDVDTSALREGDAVSVKGRLQTRGRDKGDGTGKKVYEQEAIASSIAVGESAMDDV